jgi:hypothetical protein
MMTDIPDNDEHLRPDNVSDATVEATGKTSEALEWVERARGHLYEFHQMMGHADATFGQAADLLDRAGHPDQANELREVVVGRNILPGRWSFQVVEEFDDGYYADAKQSEKKIRDDLVEGRRHIFESEMKEDLRTHDRPGHESRPS